MHIPLLLRQKGALTNEVVRVSHRGATFTSMSFGGIRWMEASSVGTHVRCDQQPAERQWKFGDGDTWASYGPCVWWMRLLPTIKGDCGWRGC